ncbi:alpha/beta hydrolase [Mesonia ostreae]|uniref:Alpha/beta hydrolase n=1 Tax=Mesonia ostreae TaxID=861110 RepID=A0ABU2KLS6_9FLAO|nr:alpha/beta hydrolase [Mesonia ostreae]MDT0295632.1 alpha/beta hydrolase [Mesonia ostreae]
MKKFYILLLIGFAQLSMAQTKIVSHDIKINQFVEGTLVTPTSVNSSPLAIILNDAGAVDRNGNERTQINNATKKLAEALAQNGIATFRYDKRIFRAEKLKLRERDFRFDFFVEDAIASLKYFKNKNKFSSLYIIGRGQGSLVGMLAAQELADGFISIGGVAESIDQIIIDQIKNQAPGLSEDAVRAFAELKERGKVYNYSPALESILRKNLQPFMASWMAYSPEEEIKKLNIPVLLLHGGKDLQASLDNFEQLNKVKPSASNKLIENMNYVLVDVKGQNDMVNQKTYYNKDLAISPKLMESIRAFIQQK